ncbi:guanylate kinase, partial [Candidatus Bipolaricaulota bacterium]|nr:guanylate kinase [Candidatus Bipolaricaulota bacterium]
MSSDEIAVRRRGAGRGLAFVVSGPSGAGKNSVIDRVMELEPDLAFSVSYTTRPRRRREVAGVDYHYVSRDEFARLLGAGELVEHVTYHEEQYGTGRAQIDATVAAGRDVILNVDVEGAKRLQISGMPPYIVVYVFLVPSTLGRLEERLRARGTEDTDQIADRLRIA